MGGRLRTFHVQPPPTLPCALATTTAGLRHARRLFRARTTMPRVSFCAQDEGRARQWITWPRVWGETNPLLHSPPPPDRRPPTFPVPTYRLKPPTAVSSQLWVWSPQSFKAHALDCPSFWPLPTLQCVLGAPQIPEPLCTCTCATALIQLTRARAAPAYTHRSPHVQEGAIALQTKRWLLLQSQSNAFVLSTAQASLCRSCR